MLAWCFSVSGENEAFAKLRAREVNKSPLTLSAVIHVKGQHTVALKQRRLHARAFVINAGFSMSLLDDVSVTK